MPERKMIWTRKGFGISDELDGSIDDAIKTLYEYKARYAPQGLVRLSWDSQPYSEGNELYLEIGTLETDEQFATRLAKEAESAQVIRARELRELERLTKKYSPNVCGS